MFDVGLSVVVCSLYGVCGLPLRLWFVSVYVVVYVFVFVADSTMCLSG